MEQIVDQAVNQAVALPSALQHRCFDPLEAPAVQRPWPLTSLWHLASLDAPTVAVVWTLAFAWAARVSLPLWLLVVIALAAWCFYVGDRLLDAHNARTPLQARHHFHWKHRRIFIPLALAAAVVAAAVVLHSMPLAARARNSVLAAAALAYFTSVHSPWRLPFPRIRVPKELLVGILFTLACAIPTWARMATNRAALLPAILCFIALAWLNCHAIESWESQSNSPRRFTIPRLAVALAGAGLLGATVSIALHHPRPSALLTSAALSASLLALLDHIRRSLAPVALRAAADLVLLVPLALLAVR